MLISSFKAMISPAPNGSGSKIGPKGLLLIPDLVSVPSGSDFLNLQTKGSILGPLRFSMEPASYKHLKEFVLLPAM